MKRAPSDLDLGGGAFLTVDLGLAGVFVLSCGGLCYFGGRSKHMLIHMYLT